MLFVIIGDELLALVAYQRVSLLYSHISSQHYPNGAAIAKLFAEGKVTNECQLTVYAKACCVPAYVYFREKFDGDLKRIIRAFKAVCCFSPSKVSELKPTTADISSLAAFPFLNTKLINGLKAELSEYLAAAEDVSVEVLSIRPVYTVHWNRFQRTQEPVPRVHTETGFTRTGSKRSHLWSRLEPVSEIITRTCKCIF